MHDLRTEGYETQRAVNWGPIEIVGNG